MQMLIFFISSRVWSCVLMSSSGPLLAPGQRAPSEPVFLVGMAARPSACPSALIGTSQPAPTLKILPPIYMTAKRRQRAHRITIF